MVAVIGRLDLDVGETGEVEQVAGELPAGAGKVRPLVAMPAHDVTDPPLRAERDGKQQSEKKRGEDRHAEGFF